MIAQMDDFIFRAEAQRGRAGDFGGDGARPETRKVKGGGVRSTGGQCKSHRQSVDAFFYGLGQYLQFIQIPPPMGAWAAPLPSGVSKFPLSENQQKGLALLPK